MTRSTHSQDGFTLIELLIVVAIIGIIAAIAVPGLLRSRMSANEASAIASMRAIDSAEQAYAFSCGSGGYAQTLADLLKAPPGGTTGYISPDLGANGTKKSGYVVNLGVGTSATTILAAASTCNGSGSDAMASFFAEAHPVAIGSTGQRSFGTDNGGTIFQDPTGATFTAASVAAGIPIQ